MEDQKLSALVDNIISVKPLFYKTLGKPFPANADITPGAYYIMLYLKKHESLSMSDLGKIMMVSKPNVTALVNQLITKEFVIRFSNKLDRRIIMIRLSSKGNHFVDKNNQKYLNQLTKRLASLTNDELELFSASLQNVKDILSRIPICETPDCKK
ncbi:MAG: MarR family transcriptional regulator [Bacteroidota bacterium]